MNFAYGPSGGINLEDPEILLGDDQVANADNFSFESIATSRPGIVLRNKPAIARNIIHALSSDSIVGPQTIYVCSTGFQGEVYREDQNGTITPFFWTPIPTPPSNPYWFESSQSTMCWCNGNVLLAWGSQGLAKITVISSTATLTENYWRFVTAHRARSIVAYRTSGGIAAPITVAWSTVLNETDFAGAGSGEVVLSESNGPITCLFVIDDVVVVGRADGFHLGQPTGVASAPFQWKCWSRQGVGPQDHNDAACDGRTIYFVGQDDVYAFDGVQLVPIGRSVRKELISFRRQGVKFRGFTCSAIGKRARRQYHLVPIGRSNVPHYVLDLETGKWSRHSYNFVTGGGWAQVDSDRRVRPALTRFDTPGQVLVWDEDTPCERPQRLIGRCLTFGDLDMDHMLRRVRMVARSRTPEPVSVTVSAESSSAAPLVKEAGDHVLLTNEQMFRRFDAGFRLSGIFHQISIEVPSQSTVEIAALQLDVEENGETRKSNA